MKKMLISLFLPILSLSASEFTIYKTANTMSFSSDDFSVVVPNYMISKSVREMKPERLVAILESGNAYLSFNECSDGNYAVDIHGRVKGAGIAGGCAGYAMTKIVVPMAIVFPSAAVLYAAKAVIHLKAGAAAGEAFQKGVIDQAMPKISEAAFNLSDTAAPAVGAITGIFSPA